MSLQDEMTAAAQEYARRLETQREANRLAAIQLEVRHHDNATAFATAVEGAFAALDNEAPEPNDNDLADLADAIRNDAPEENNR